jgi:hypothetical protein
MTPLRFTLDEAMVVKAARLATTHFYPRLLWLGGIIGLVVSAFFILRQQVWALDRALIQLGLTVAGAMAITGVVILILRHGVVPFEARRNYRQQKGLSDEFSLTWTDADFCLEAGQSRTAMPFTHLHGYRSSDDVIILYHSEMIYHAIPVTAFGGADRRDAFLLQLQQAGVRAR